MPCVHVTAIVPKLGLESSGSWRKRALTVMSFPPPEKRQSQWDHGAEAQAWHLPALPALFRGRTPRALAPTWLVTVGPMCHAP